VLTCRWRGSDCVALWPADAEGCAPDNDGSGASTPAAISDGAPKYLFSASDDGTVRVWDLDRRECVRVLEGHVAQVQSLKVVTLDEHASFFGAGDVSTQPGRGSRVASDRSHVVGEDYDVEADQPPPIDCTTQLDLIPASRSAVGGATHDGFPSRPTLPRLDFGLRPKPLLISASLDNTLKLWDIETATCRKTLFGEPWLPISLKIRRADKFPFFQVTSRASGLSMQINSES
jgi:F-box/WD-40 domain protein MET30